MMKRLAFGLVLALTAVSSTAFADKKNYKSDNFEGSESGSPSTGAARLTYDTVTKKLCGSILFDPALTGPVTTIDIGRIDMGPAAFRQFPPGAGVSPIKINVVLTDQEFANFPDVFINLKTAMNVGGEISGTFEEGGEEQVCEEPDAGPPVNSSSGTSGENTSSGTSGESSSGSSGLSSEDDDPPAKKAAPKKEEGCNTSGTSGSGLAVAGLVGLAVAFATRGRRRR